MPDIDPGGWKRLHDSPSVASARGNCGRESIWYVAVEGSEFRLKLSPDAAEALGHQLINSAANTRRRESEESRDA